MSGDGFLAIWNDVKKEDETDYLQWLTQEHIAERLGVSGFLECRVFRANTIQPRYLIIYTLGDQSVLASSEYLERLNDPTDWSKRIMRKLLNFKRGGGKLGLRQGTGSGGVVAALFDCDMNVSQLKTLAKSDLIIAMSLFQTDRAMTDIRTAEKAIRERDNSFDQLLLIEGLTEEAVTDYVGCTLATLASELTLYRLVFTT
jgi:hypothetical protein